MNKIKINRDIDELRHLDDLGEAAMKSPKLMDLIVNGATLMSVNKDTLRGIIRVIITGADAEVEQMTEKNTQLRAVIEQMDPDFFKRKCHVCGCTWDHACEGGCFWVGDDLCSRCLGEKLRKGENNG